MNKILIAVMIGLVAMSAHADFLEKFDKTWEKRWVETEFKKDVKEKGYFEHTAGDWTHDSEEGKGIKTTEDNRFYCIAHKFKDAMSSKGKELVVQYELKFTQEIDCGGGYLKLAKGDFEPEKFNDQSDYEIMFGPDICGGENKIHTIFSYNGQNHLWKKKPAAEKDQLSHVYRLVVKPDNTYEVSVDGTVKESGNLEDDFDFLPAKKINDPEASKPADWVDEKEIADPKDQKPTDWDSIPETIPDPEAKQPEDWDEEEDGEWTAPQIPNPDYKGEWKAKNIPNPDYKGEWEHPQVANPEYKADDNLHARESLTGVAIDVWQVKAGTHFDNIFIGFDMTKADDLLSAWKKNKEVEKKAFEDGKKAKDEANKKAEEAKKAAEESEKEKAAENESEDDEEDL